MKKVIISTLGTLLLSSLFFTACGSKKVQTNEVINYVNPELKGAPKWVIVPFVQGSVSEIGSAPKNAGNDFSFQREEAMADARDNLAKQISIKVSNIFKSYKASTGSNDDSTFDKSNEKVSKQIADETLNGTVVKDTWMSSSGTFYILMAINSENVSERMEKSIKTSFRNDEALYQQFIAAKAQGQLNKELEEFRK